MEPNFWFQRWATNDIGFHEKDVNPALVNHFKELALTKGQRVFVPLCGKTLDIAWFLKKGYRVAGAELSPKAIDELFAGLRLKPTITAVGDMGHYRADHIDIFVGDIFHLTKKMLGPVDAVYDRAALVALPKDMRIRYTRNVKTLTDCAPQLLVSFEYDQALMEGPPFSVSDAEINEHYHDDYHLTLLDSHEIPGGLKGKCEAKENIWLLKTREPDT